ncbi:MAG TPA: DUF1343 domain-containing protein [Tepidisphaeraceae bacterium]|nr:DUF1343 domain-containing protein [Tepidisphaeraceae bacterium]
MSSTASAQVLTGLDVLQQDEFKALAGRRVGIITNHTGVSRDGTHLIQLLTGARGVTVVRLFSPEHGLYGEKDEHIGDGVDAKSGLPIVSLYGKVRTPTPEMLADLDTLVFDMQDVGARYYTYIATMGNCMKAAAGSGVEFVVLDRPNPVTGLIVDGPNPDAEHIGKFTCFGPFPVSHGMTIGELAQLFNKEYGIGCDLQVVKMQGWKREMWWDETGVKWVNPSPNLRSPTQALLYLSIGLMEASNVSVGRGTNLPFECFGAPWIKASELAAALNEQNLPGLEFSPIEFTPTNTPHKIHRDVRCEGVRVTVTDRNAVKPVLSGIIMAWTLERLYENEYNYDAMLNLMMNKGVRDEVKKMSDPRTAEALWRDDVDAFKALRQGYLIY